MSFKMKIRDIAVYHPSDIVNNEYYFKHFEKQKKDVRHFFCDILGRENRYMIQNEGKDPECYENSLTMQIEAAQKVLEKCNLTGQDIQGIICATQFPEYLVPASIMFIHKAIHAGQKCFGYDINSNCVGMLMALQQAGQYFQCDSKVKRILIVAGDTMNIGMQDTDEALYGVYGDCACAMVVEACDDDSAILDTDFFMNDSSLKSTLFPQCGMTQLIQDQNLDMYSCQTSVPNCDIPIVIETIQDILERNHLQVNDIAGFCFSQYVKYNNKKIMKALEIPEEKCPFVADEYGYTGCSSPFLALERLLSEGKIKRGDYVFFWTMGVAIQHTFLLIKF